MAFLDEYTNMTNPKMTKSFPIIHWDEKRQSAWRGYDCSVVGRDCAGTNTACGLSVLQGLAWDWFMSRTEPRGFNYSPGVHSTTTYCCAVPLKESFKASAEPWKEKCTAPAHTCSFQSDRKPTLNSWKAIKGMFIWIACHFRNLKWYQGTKLILCSFVCKPLFFVSVPKRKQ